MVAKLLDERGEPRYTVHQLRHTRGTELVNEGHALHIIQRVLGQTDPHSTQLYADVTEDHVRLALETGRYVMAHGVVGADTACDLCASLSYR